MAEDTKLRLSRANPPYSSGAAATARSASSDPLVELARLIGQEDAIEPRREPAGASLRSSPVSASQMPASERLEAATRELSRSLGLRDPRTMRSTASSVASPSAQNPPVHQTSTSPSPSRAVPASAGDIPREDLAPHALAPYDAPSAEEYAQAPADDCGTYADPYADPYYAAEPDQADAYADEDIGPLPPERRRGGLITVAAVLGLAAIGTAGAVGYRTYMADHSSAPPIIKADSTPAKIVPPQPKGEAANRVVYNRADKNPIERILSREEQPIEMKEAKTSGPTMVMPSIGSGAAIARSPTPAGEPITGSTSTQPAANEPKKVKTVAVRPDGTIIPDSARAVLEPDPSTVTGGQTAPRLPVARPGGAPTGATARRNAPPTQTASVVPTSTPNGSHVVQLTSQKTEAEAEASFRALQARYPNVLGGWQPLIRRVDLGARGTYYRAQVGPFASIEEANEFCSNLKAAGGQCIVQKN